MAINYAAKKNLIFLKGKMKENVNNSNMQQLMLLISFNLLKSLKKILRKN